MPSAKQTAANQRNAKKSTGPKSQRGKDAVKYNALTHGLRCDLDVLPCEDRAQYEMEIGNWLKEWNPQDATRMRLVEKAMRSSWRLKRVFRAENALFTKLSNKAVAAFELKNCQEVGEAKEWFEKGRSDASHKFNVSYNTMTVLVDKWKALSEHASTFFGWHDAETHHNMLCDLMDGSVIVWPVSTAKMLEISRQVHEDNQDRESYDLTNPDDVAAEERAQEFAGYISECVRGCERHRATFMTHAQLRKLEMHAAMVNGGAKADRLLKYEAAADRALSSALKELKNLGEQDLDEFRQDEAPQPAIAQAPADAKPDLIETLETDTNKPNLDITLVADEVYVNPFSQEAEYPTKERMFFTPSGELTAECELRLQARAAKYAEQEAYDANQSLIPASEPAPRQAERDRAARVWGVVSDDSPPSD